MITKILAGVLAAAQIGLAISAKLLLNAKEANGQLSEQVNRLVADVEHEANVNLLMKDIMETQRLAFEKEQAAAKAAIKRLERRALDNHEKLVSVRGQLANAAALASDEDWACFSSPVPADLIDSLRIEATANNPPD